MSPTAFGHEEESGDVISESANVILPLQKSPIASGRQTILDPNSDSFDPASWLQALSAYRRPNTPGGYIFRHLNVDGTLPSSAAFKTSTSVAFAPFRFLGKLLGRKNVRSVRILRDLEGFVNDGEMLAVLGRSGSGCTTLLKVLAGAARELRLDQNSEIKYQGITPDIMYHEFRGQCTYTAEFDAHFPELTVWETIKIAVAARCPKCVISDMSRSKYIEHVTSAILRIFNLTSARDTKIGNELVRGVSGGELRRVTIAEAFVSFSPVQFWDNSTRGMDSATALQCIRNFQKFTRLNSATTTLSLYQASQSILDHFDRVTVLYEGQQIFFGTWDEALGYFQSLGFRRPQRCTTGDFLTALTNPVEARSMIIPNWTSIVPETSNDFAEAWKKSEQRRKVSETIERLCAGWTIANDQSLASFRASRSIERSGHLGPKSPYMIAFSAQLSLCLHRGFRRLSNNLVVPVSFVMGNAIMAIIIGSVFFEVGVTADDIPKRSVLLFFSILVNAFMSGFEVLTIWSQRPIVERHARHALYSPIIEAVSSMLCDMPAKIAASLSFNLTLYFMTNLRRTLDAFFIFFLFSFGCLMAMSMFFRCVGSIGRTHDQIMVPIGIAIMLCIIYAGFIIPVPYMKPWLSWFRRIDPVAYAFESLIINEFRNRQFQCTQFIPSGLMYDQIPQAERTCMSRAATAGSSTVNGDQYMKMVYNYNVEHLWPNLGAVCLFMVFFCIIHIWSSRQVTVPQAKGNILQRLNGQQPSCRPHDEEHGQVQETIGASTASFDPAASSMNRRAATIHWEGISYAIKAEKGEKKILDDIDGFVEPGTLTALMGATGAGKTTLLDVLSKRKTVGVITGDIFIDGNPPDNTFERKSGYAPQTDYHLPTATVKEALRFSAELRQHASVPKADKLKHADNIISLLNMDLLADAIVDSLNVEQRKRLTIGIELAAKPDLLLFLDEPTSGMDSQTAFIICNLLRRLAQLGHTIMCTIHQPSAGILEMFDRLLLIEKGGKTVYFGDLGGEATTMIQYFQSRGARLCGEAENPAEWMLEVTGATPQSLNTIDWHEAWLASTQRQQLKQKLAQLKQTLSGSKDSTYTTTGEFAVSFATQLGVMLHRTMIEYWRTPSPLYAKLLFYCGAAVVIGASCYKSPHSIQGIQNLVFALFLLFTTFSNVMQKIVPQFESRRALFEARERPSKTFSWQAFIASSLLVEAFWQIILAIMSFAILYYLTGFHLYTTNSDQAERGGLMLLMFIGFFLFTSSLSQALIAGIEAGEAAVNIGQLLFYLMLIFCGAILTKAELPHFWMFMYRASPLTYMLRSMFAVGVAGQPITCGSSESVPVPAVPNMNCGEYLRSYMSVAGGRVENPSSTNVCMYCPFASTDEFLMVFNMAYGERWRDLGIVFVFVIFNLGACFGIYWLARVPKRKLRKGL